MQATRWFLVLTMAVIGTWIPAANAGTSLLHVITIYSSHIKNRKDINKEYALRIQEAERKAYVNCNHHLVSADDVDRHIDDWKVSKIYWPWLQARGERIVALRFADVALDPENTRIMFNALKGKFSYGCLVKYYPPSGSVNELKTGLDLIATWAGIKNGTLIDSSECVVVKRTEVDLRYYTEHYQNCNLVTLTLKMDNGRRSYSYSPSRVKCRMGKFPLIPGKESFVVWYDE